MITDKKIFEQVQKALKATTGLELKLQNRLTGSARALADFAVTIDYPDRRNNEELDEERILWAEVKKNLTSTQISELALRSKDLATKIVLVTQQVTSQQADWLRELNIPFCDTAGNAYFKESGLYVFVTGRKTEVIKEKTSRLFDKAGLKILFALLTQSDLIEKDLRTIASEAGVGSVSTVSDIFKDLEKQRYLHQSGSAIVRRKLNNKSDLLKRWVEGYSERLRPTLKPVRFRSKKYDGRWWDDVNISQYNACWGGEIGGAYLTKHLKPAIATIYSDSLLPRLQAQYGLVRDEYGNVEILRKFWTKGEIDDIAPPLVIYADLVASADRRNLETAQIVYDKYLIKLTEGAA
jgi:hypothetical protein